MILRIAAASILTCAVAAHGADDAASSGAWQGLRASFYGTKDIGEVDESLMRLTAPASTPDPGATPVVLHFGPGAAGKVGQVRLIIDHNPSPLAASLQLAPGVPIDEIEMRVRIDRATSVRAVAELDDGRIEMRSVWVNASGGCSAPPGASGAGTLGEIRLRPSADGTSLLATIRHPNHSGFQIDPVSGDAIAPHFITHIRLTSGSKVLLEGDTGISISENPTVRIASERKLPLPVTLEAVDSKQARFEASTPARGG